jgi:hypothetical protein
LVILHEYKHKTKRIFRQCFRVKKKEMNRKEEDEKKENSKICNPKIGGENPSEN